MSPALYLIEVANADREAKDKIGRTPLHNAAINSSDIVKYLVEEAHADKDARDS